MRLVSVTLIVLSTSVAAVRAETPPDLKTYDLTPRRLLRGYSSPFFL
jgi:hypothetical protein